MHKSYQATVPVSNRFLKKKWDDKYYSNHLISVRHAQARIDATPPQTYLHLHMKFKKLQLEEERTATIERDNRILLEKMAHIMRTTGSVDSHNDYQLKSLNQGKRRQDLLRVSKENENIIKRLIAQKLDTNRDNWKDNWSKNTLYLNNIAKYDADWYLSKPNGHQLNNGKYMSKRCQSIPREDNKPITNVENKYEKEKTMKDNND
ncbi:unnamed protein product [Rotaria sordida]|uniref:Uncharacterized protein n=1 Tax=Rotaria sordida TaxID=392033 RepID=A0A813ZTW4_9BILA|nr:unnamed protein product [Rotaria sordida]CAF0940946.1 unnamed protein product [Rotaria sordida]